MLWDLYHCDRGSDLIFFFGLWVGNWALNLLSFTCIQPVVNIIVHISNAFLLTISMWYLKLKCLFCKLDYLDIIRVLEELCKNQMFSGCHLGVATFWIQWPGSNLIWFDGKLWNKGSNSATSHWRLMLVHNSSLFSVCCTHMEATVIFLNILIRMLLKSSLGALEKKKNCIVRSLLLYFSVEGL